MQFLAVFSALVANAAQPSAEELEASAQELFDDACTMCHDETDDNIALEGGLSKHIGAPSSGNMPMITAGDPDNSYLYVKISGGPKLHGDLMPLDEDPLTVEQITLVHSWISAMPADATTGPTGERVAPTQPANPNDAAEAPANTTGSASTNASGSANATAASHSTAAANNTAPPAIIAPKAPARPAFPGTHQVAMHTTTALGAKVYEFRVHHRFGRFGNPRSYGGLRDGATISLGSGYGITDNLDVLLRFSTSRLAWELGTKYVPLQQEKGLPLSVGVFGSLELLTEEPERAANRFTGNVQAMASRLWFERIATQATVGWSWLTNHSPSPRIDFGDGPEAVTDKRGTLNAGVAATFLLGKKRRHGIDVEYLLPIPATGETPDLFYVRGGDADPGGSSLGSWALGWSARTGLHLFQVFLTNNRNIHTNLVAPGADLGHPFSEWGEFFLGFNLSRKWKW